MTAIVLFFTHQTQTQAEKETHLSLTYSHIHKAFSTILFSLVFSFSIHLFIHLSKTFLWDREIFKRKTQAF